MRTLPRHAPANRGRNEVSLAQVRPIVAPNRGNVIGAFRNTPTLNPSPQGEGRRQIDLQGSSRINRWAGFPPPCGEGMRVG